MPTCQFSEATWHACLYDYQSLVGGLLAFIAALLTAGFLWAQIRQQRYINNDVRNRRLKSARAMLPDALSGLGSYLEQCIDLAIRMAIDAQFDEENGEVIERGMLTIPRADPSYISILRDIIEQSDSAPNDSIVRILSKLQIQRARLEGRNRKYYCDRRGKVVLIPDAVGAYEKIIDAAELYAEIETLFDYARFRSDAPKQLDTLKQAAAHLQFQYEHEDWYPKFGEYIRSQLAEDDDSEI